MKTLLLEKLFALAVAGVIVSTVFLNIAAPLTAAMHTTQAVGAEVQSVARVFVTGKRMTMREKVEYDTRVVVKASAGMETTAAR
jgi:hypothetical protein